MPVVQPKAFAALLDEFCKKAAEFVLEHPEYCQVAKDHTLKDDMDVESLRSNDFLENRLIQV